MKKKYIVKIEFENGLTIETQKTFKTLYELQKEVNRILKEYQIIISDFKVSFIEEVKK